MQLSREDIFTAWAPADSPWSVWAKPVLFATAPYDADLKSIEVAPALESFEYASGAAVIVDLPGLESILYALSLARAGYQPVPLYNGVAGTSSLVDMDVIARGLTAGAKVLATIARRPDARPVFLLNSDRHYHGFGALAPGRFDNRWSLVPQDMPSAKFLQANGIRQVILISDKAREDLTHILFRYQEAKIDLKITPDGLKPSQPLNLTRPMGFRSLWYRAGVFAGLRRNAAGGFGAMTPIPSESSGFYGGGG